MLIFGCDKYIIEAIVHNNSMIKPKKLDTTKTVNILVSLLSICPFIKNKTIIKILKGIADNGKKTPLPILYTPIYY